MVPAPLGRFPGFGRPLPVGFYARPTATVARALLGCRIVHRTTAGDLAARIVETEAYRSNDPASHAFRGPTARNASMFGPPATLYVFRIHQVHCANAVTRPGEAVLLRAAAPVSRGLPSTRGPGRLCRALEIGLEFNGTSLSEGPVRILAGEGRNGAIVAGPRIGISKATEAPLRFAVAADPFVSGPRPWRR